MIEGLYIHIPFCTTKCHYCDFTSFVHYDQAVQKRYVQGIKKESKLIKEHLEDGLRLKSIFIGGGTPTCLSGGLLLDLIASISSLLPLGTKPEVTIEANPGTLCKEKAEALVQGGINRVSLGVQSFEPGLLRNIGRQQEIENIYQSLELLRAAGINNINLDLMYGLPGQKLSHWEKTLREAINLGPEHISLYQLKVEENTPLGQKLLVGLIEEFCDERALEMYQLARGALGQGGYHQYEISNFAKPGYRSVHNQLYWQSKSYLGLGAGAHSYLPPRRVENLGNLEKYLEFIEGGQLPPREIEVQDMDMAMSEYVFMGLRMLEGVSLARFSQRFDRDLCSIFAQAIEKCGSRGLIQLDKGYLKLTEAGIYLGNLVFQEFLLD